MSHLSHPWDLTEARMSGTNLATATGRLVILSGPSGVGKNTLINRARSAHPDLGELVTATTRQQRLTEVDGVNYHYWSRNTFEQKVVDGEMVEWNQYAENLYGTPRSSIETCLRAGGITLGKVDINGVLKLKALYGGFIVYVQLLPPGGTLEAKLRTLERRILEREPGQAGTVSLQKRLDTARDELIAMSSPEVARLVSRRIINRHVDQATASLIELIAELKAQASAPAGE